MNMMILTMMAMIMMTMINDYDGLWMMSVMIVMKKMMIDMMFDLC